MNDSHLETVPTRILLEIVFVALVVVIITVAVSEDPQIVNSNFEDWLEIIPTEANNCGKLNRLGHTKNYVWGLQKEENRLWLFPKEESLEQSKVLAVFPKNDPVKDLSCLKDRAFVLTKSSIVIFTENGQKTVKNLDRSYDRLLVQNNSSDSLNIFLGQDMSFDQAESVDSYFLSKDIWQKRKSYAGRLIQTIGNNLITFYESDSTADLRVIDLHSGQIVNYGLPPNAIIGTSVAVNNNLYLVIGTNVILHLDLEKKRIVANTAVPGSAICLAGPNLIGCYNIGPGTSGLLRNNYIGYFEGIIQDLVTDHNIIWIATNTGILTLNLKEES
ncbi:MAG: hypothetical protein COU22_02375 [Candidatus Komeilibacteria bacterium CG10_big_fil_rev_8_21_14_0_10_41_13]|uniref:Uncharacterized protein n=1 Tax=Candidatus Komeilibacteria bacterium CG10_big_fil_rev_8_21_14_0_10_41_13 TaxID=1974476 RepID=A0A2M6WC69_9BACT|nr:MAG: hypothetical protein COU22_02375 [Candidatus Komeilibacteria bacterium CG10_big_fil_rev_8_21_14_0_10_41_13]